MYKHGAYGEMLPTQDYVAPVHGGTLPVYVGRAPIHQVEKGEVGAPVLISSWREAVRLLGYSEDWEHYELSEAVYAHFRNNLQTIGPIVCINVLDPAVHCRAGTPVQVTPVQNRAQIQNRNLILSSLKIEGMVLGEDFTAQYSETGETVELSFLQSSGAAIQVSFQEAHPEAVDEEDLLKGLAQGIPLIYQRMNKEPNLLCCPGWSHKPRIHDAMIGAVQDINGHWDAYVHTDIPANTIEEAIAFKERNAYTSPYETPCFPLFVKGERVFHASVIRTVVMQQTDFANHGIPFETPSNKPADITGLLAWDKTPMEYDQQEANRLNEKGISTATYWGGRWVIWGSHTGAFTYGKDLDPKEKHDCSIRMLLYLTNEFQRRYGILVDKPMNRSRIDTILNDFGAFLDTIKGNGGILFGEIRFEESSNPVSDIIEGDFVFDVRTTTTPPGKSLTALVRYTIQGIHVLYGGEAS